MRTDDAVARPSFRGSQAWKTDPASGEPAPDIDSRLDGTATNADGQLVVHSLSGNERNHLFINDAGTAFHDASALAGLDNPADSRAWALLDYDHDGFQDIALVNANAPLLNLYHNDLGKLAPSQDNRFVALRFVGGNTTSNPSPELSNRGGYGAHVTAKIGDRTIVREHRCGEGYASQHSATMIIGIGSATQVDSLTVRWPSGKISTAENIPTAHLLTLHETSADQTDLKPYSPVTPAQAPPEAPLTKFPVDDPAASARLRLYTTTATWCPSCIAHLPRQQHLRNAFDPAELELVALPVDPEDTPEKLAAYAQKHKPPYRQLTTADPTATVDFLKSTLDTTDPPLPSTVITDADGNVLDTLTGLPTVSQLRKLLSQ